MHILVVHNFFGGLAPRSNVIQYHEIFKYFYPWHLNFVLQKDFLDSDLSNVTAIIFLHNQWWPTMPQQIVNKLREFLGPKLVFIQDEHQMSRSTTSMLNECCFDVLFSVATEVNFDKLYSGGKFEIFPCSTVYVGSNTQIKKNSGKIDVSYRGSSPPFYLGELAQAKVSVKNIFLSAVTGTNLTHDVSTSIWDRMHDSAWVSLLAKSKFVLGTPSGASLFDYYGHYAESEVHYRNTNQKFDFFEWRRNNNLDNVDWTEKIDTISPRVIEVIKCGGVNILTHGEYAGILEPNIHYIEASSGVEGMREALELTRYHKDVNKIRNAASKLLTHSQFDPYPIAQKIAEVTGLGVQPKSTYYNKAAVQLKFEELEKGGLSLPNRALSLNPMFSLIKLLKIIYAKGRTGKSIGDNVFTLINFCPEFILLILVLSYTALSDAETNNRFQRFLDLIVGSVDPDCALEITLIRQQGKVLTIKGRIQPGHYSQDYTLFQSVLMYVLNEAVIPIEPRGHFNLEFKYNNSRILAALLRLTRLATNVAVFEKR